MAAKRKKKIVLIAVIAVAAVLCAAFFGGRYCMRYFGEKAIAEMEKILEDYLKTVRGVSDLCEGEFSDSTKIFSDVVEQILKDGAGETLRGLNNAMSVYIGALDDADGNWN